MEIRTALTLALVLIIALWVPVLHLLHPSGEGARTHLVHMVEAAGSLRHRPGRWSPTDSTRRRRCAGGSLLIASQQLAPGVSTLRACVVTVRGRRGCRSCLAKFLGCAVQTSDGRGSERPDARSQARIVRLPSGARKGRHQLAVFGTFARGHLTRLEL